MIREKRVISFSFFQQNLHLTREKIIRTFGTNITVARNSVEVKVLMFQLVALASDFVRMNCKVVKDSIEVKILLFQFGALVSNYVRMKCKVARDSCRNQSLVISVGRSSK